MNEQNRIREYDEMGGTAHDDGYGWVREHGVTWYDIENRKLYPGCRKTFMEFYRRHKSQIRIWATSDKPKATVYYHLEDIYTGMRQDTEENLKKRTA